MRAIRVCKFGSPEVLQIVNDFVLPPLKNGEVLVRVVYCGVNPIETYVREGQHTLLPQLPYTPGSDAAGFVADMGENIPPEDFRLCVGERVFVTGVNTGAYAEYLIANSAYVFHLPARLSLAQGAALGLPYFTAYKAINMSAELLPGETVLVHGASGAVGNAAVQISRGMGAIVTGTAGTKDGMEIVSLCGAHHVFNHNHKSYEKKMILSTGGRGFDVIIEHLANVNLKHDLHMAAGGSRVVIVGCRGTAEMNPRNLMTLETCIKGVCLGTSTLSQWRELGASVIGGIETGTVNPIISGVYTIDEVQQIHHDIIHQKGAKGKLVMEIVSDDKEEIEYQRNHA